jgi:ACS family glucarate transporter-like MFS transporter
MNERPPPADDPQRSSNVRWLVFALACGMSALLYLHRYTWAILKVEVTEEFGWSKETLGWLDAAFMFSYSFGQIPGGMLGDWFGTRWVLGIMALVWSLAMGGMGLTRGVASMAWIRGVFGAAQAGCYPNLNKVTKVWFPFAERTTVQGWVSSFSGRVGGAASFILFGTVMLGFLKIPWRTALGCLTVVGIVFFGLWMLLFRSGPRQHPWANASEADLISAGDPTAGVSAGSVIDWRRVFCSPYVWALLFHQFTAAFVDGLFSHWFPLYLSEAKGIKLQSGGWMSALPLLGGALGGMLAGGMLQTRLIKATGNRRWSRSAVGMCGNLAAGLCLFASLMYSDARMVTFWFVALKFFADWSQPTVWGTVTDMAGRNSASLFALVNMSGAISGIVSGPIMGKTVDHFGRGEPGNPAGWTALFIGIAIIYLLSGLSWLFIDCTKTIEGEEGGRE